MNYPFNKPQNEPVLDYEPGSPKKDALKLRIKELKSENIVVPIIIDGNEIETTETASIDIPHNHKEKLGVFHKAGQKEIDLAIESSLDAWNSWSKTSLEERCSIFNKAADLLSDKWRNTINAATMLNMSKNVYQSEIE